MRLEGMTDRAATTAVVHLQRDQTPEGKGAERCPWKGFSVSLTLVRDVADAKPSQRIPSSRGERRSSHGGAFFCRGGVALGAGNVCCDPRVSLGSSPMGGCVMSWMAASDKIV